MKNIMFIGIILLLVSVGWFYLTSDAFSVVELNRFHMMGIMGGVGIGLIIGGVVGYISKGSAIKEAKKKQEFKRLQKEKEELERRNAEIAQKEHNNNYPGL